MYALVGAPSTPEATEPAGARARRSWSRPCIFAHSSCPGTPAITALLRLLFPPSSSCSTTSKPPSEASTASKHSTSTSRYRPPNACSRNGRRASPASPPPPYAWCGGKPCRARTTRCSACSAHMLAPMLTESLACQWRGTHSCSATLSQRRCCCYTGQAALVLACALPGQADIRLQTQRTPSVMLAADPRQQRGTPCWPRYRGGAPLCTTRGYARKVGRNQA